MGKAADKKYRYGLVEWFVMILIGLAVTYMAYENIIIRMAQSAGNN